MAKADKKLRGEKPVLQHVSDAGLLSKQKKFLYLGLFLKMHEIISLK